MTTDVRPATGAEAPPPAPAPSRPGWRARLSRFDQRTSPYLFISPFYLVFILFGLFPLLFTLWVSLHDWGLASGERDFIGLENFRYLLTDGDFWHATVNTLGIFILATVPQLLLALFLANALARRMRGSTLFRIGMVAPLVTSTAAVAIVFTQMFNRDYGMINWTLGLFGMDEINWQADRFWSWGAIALMVDWRWTGYNALIYLAAMQSIPKDLYEAAAIDGASRIRQFWQITVPMLQPTIIFTVIIATIGGLQLFTEPVLFGVGTPNKMDGGSLHQFQTITMYMYDNAFTDDRYGYGATVAWALFLLIIVFSLLNFLFVRRTGGTK